MLTIVSLAVILSCAKISSPGGGPRDTEPPAIVRSQPANGSVNFTGRSFSVTFNEYVVLDRITEKFMVSPPLAEKPQVRLRGRNLVVSWGEPLADNTTYTFYFQDAIRDNNEGNPIPNYQFVFSTGPVLDSLTLTGNIFNALDLETVEDITIQMYSNLADSAPRKILPNYISRPDPSGGFTISNIKPGSYRLFALADINGNRLYDLDDEIFAFGDSIIEITPENNWEVVPDTIRYKLPGAAESVEPDIFLFGRHRLYAFTKETSKQYLKFTDRKSASSVTFGLSLPSDSGQVSVVLSEADSASWYMEESAARDTFMIWVTNPEIYDLDLIEAFITYPFTDTTGVLTSRTDTVSFRYRKPAPLRGGQARIPALSLTTNISGKIKPGTIPVFRSATPLAEPDTTLITLVQRVDSVTNELPFKLVRDSFSSTRLTMEAPLATGGSYSLICGRGAFTDIFGLASDSVTYRFSVATEEEFGSLRVHLANYEGAVIIELLNDRGVVVEEQLKESPGELFFPLLGKGKYQLRALYDLDGDGKWTTGDYDLLRLPEPVTYYPSELEVKINWSLEQDWDLSRIYHKDVSLRKKPALKR